MTVEDTKPVRIIRTPHERNFFIMSRATAQDSDLSYEALGLLTYLLSKPDSWEVNVRDISKRGSKYQTYKILRELRKAGYVTLEKEEGERFGGWIYKVFETKEGGQLLENQQVENQLVEIRHTQIIQRNTENTESLPPIPPKGGRKSIKKPTSKKPLKSWDRTQVKVYYEQYITELDTLTDAWGYNTRFQDLTTVNQIELAMAFHGLNEIRFEVGNYISLSAYTHAKLSWKSNLNPVDMLSQVEGWRTSRLGGEKAAQPTQTVERSKVVLSPNGIPVIYDENGEMHDAGAASILRHVKILNRPGDKKS